MFLPELNNNNTNTYSLYDYHKSSGNQCICLYDTNSIKVKMFDSQIVPKYIIDKDYKIIPVNPATTGVLVDGCTLTARATSQ